MEKEIDFSNKEKVEEVTDKVLFPETHIKKANISDKEISLRPLPISYAKQISKDLGTVRRMIIESGNEGGKTLPDDYDLQLIDALVRSVKTICDFYGLGLNEEKLSVNCSTNELLKFVELQVEVNSDNDFLLLPLRVITEIIRVASTGMEEAKKSLSLSSVS